MDQLFDDGANGGGGAFAAGTGADMTGEEVLELKYTPWGVHELLRGDPGNGGFMHADRFCNIVQYQWFHGFLPLFEKPYLIFHYFGGYFKQGFVAAL